MHNFSVTDKTKGVRLRKVEAGAGVIYQGHTYFKVKKKGMGAGITLEWPENHALLFNPKYGTMRAVKCDECVEVAHVDADVTITDRQTNPELFR